MKSDDLKKALKQRVSSAEWTDKDTWAVLNRVRKEKARSGNRGIYTRALAVAAAFIILFVGVLAGTGHLGLTGRPDHIQNTTEPIPLAQRKITPETKLYYIPEIGEYYHLNSNCTAVSIQHKPMQAHFTWAEVNSEAYRGLQPCSACGAPMRPALPAETAEPSVTEIPAATAVPAAGLPETGPDITDVPETEIPAESSEALDLYKYAGFSDGTAKITRLLKDVETADIPAELNGYKVVSIGKDAFSNCASLKTVTVPEGVTSIEPSAFSGCINLVSVTLPASLATIDEYSFSNCPSLETFSISPDNTVFAFENHALINKRDNSLNVFADPGNTGSYEIPRGIKRIECEAFAYTNLSSVTIPDTVTVIRPAAFMGCENLTGIVIPEGVTEIDQQAFMNCTALKSISIPNSLTSVDEGVFAGCTELASIDISPDHPVFEASGPVLIDRKKKTVVSASSAISGKYEIPDGLHNIRSSAFFDCPRLTEVIIPDGLASIGEYAFSACSGLKEITVPASVSYIGQEAFNTGSGLIVKGTAGSYAQQYCGKNGIRFEAIDSVPASESLFEYTVKEDGTVQITDLTDKTIATADIPAELDGHTVTSIWSSVFSDCEHLTGVTLPDTLTSIGDYAFSNCPALKSINIPDSLEKISTTAFEECRKLSDIRISADHPYFAVISDALVNKADMALIIYLGQDFTEYEIPAGIRTIGPGAFWGRNVTAVKIPDSVTRIESNAFMYTESLEGLSIPDSVTCLGDYVFFRSGIKTLTIPAGVTAIGRKCFAWCENLESIQVAPENPVLEMRGSLLVDKQENALVYHLDTDSGTYEIPGGFEKISDSAFFNSSLKEIIVPDSVKEIGDSAFFQCRNLESVRLPDGLQALEDTLFSNCTGLKNVNIPDSVKSINYGAFHGCLQLKEITITADVTEIGEDVFEDCGSSLVVKGIAGSNVQKYCEAKGISFEAIDSVPASVPVSSTPASESLFEYARRAGGAAEITKYLGDAEVVDIPAELDGYKVMFIGECAFDQCDALKAVTVPEGVTTIDSEAFNYCLNLTSVTLPASLVTLHGNPFGHCPKLETVSVSPDNSVYAVENNALISRKDSTLICVTNHTDTGSCQIPQEIKLVGDRAFDSCGFSSVTIPDTVKSLGYGAFMNCENLKELVIPDGVTDIGNQAFFECSALQSVSIPDSVESIGNGTFNGCSLLKSIEISPDHPVYEVRDLLLVDKRQSSIVSGTAAISGKLGIPAGISKINGTAFQGCFQLTEVIIPEGVKSIESGAFRACRMLREITVPASVTSIEGDAFNTYNNTVVIKGPAGSYAQRYCRDNGIRFEEIEAVPVAESLYEYTVKTDGTAEITKAADTILDAVIPAELDGYKVTSIRTYTFGLDSRVQSVTIPEGVTAISSHAFFCCKNLAELTLPDSLARMEESPIYSCRNLKTINISPAHPVYAFENHTLVSKRDSTLICFLDPGATNSYVVPQGIKRIGDSAFEHSSFRSVTIPDTVESIGATAFELCTNLKEIIIPDSVSWIGHQAFFECSALESIRFPDNINSIGDGAFSGCRSLTSIEISPDHPVYEVKDLVLIDKKRSRIVSASAAISGKYTVPEGILSIGDESFQSCVSLTEIVVPESLSEIGPDAFNACDKLRLVTIPGAATEIGDAAFSTCSDFLVVKAPAGSVAQKYCEENGIKFAELENDTNS